MGISILKIINEIAIIYLGMGISILIIYGLWKGKNREYIDVEIGGIIIIIMTLLLSNSIIQTLGLILGLIINILGYSIMGKKEKIVDGIRKWELPILKLFVILGFLIIISAKDFLYLYIGIESISLTFYLLAGIRTGGVQQEASLKYFILGSLGSGLLLFGIVWIYKETGSIDYIEINNILDNKIGPIFIIISLLLKMAAAPLHMWAPDVYEGSPTYITAIFAMYPKLVYLYTIYDLIIGAFYNYQDLISNILMISGLLSITVGSIAAINQTNFKRFIAYSGISHTGWILLGLSTFSDIGLVASFIYLIIYIIMNINTFGVILSFPVFNISHLIGFFKNHPFFGSLLTLNLMSMSGIPPLFGFVSKFFILYALYISNNFFIALVALAISIVGAYNYIRIIKNMAFMPSKFTAPDTFALPLSLSLSLLLAISSWFTLTGIYLTYPLLSLLINSLF